MKGIEILNGNVVIEILDIEVEAGTNLTDPTGKKIASKPNFKEHPWQGRVIACDRYYYNNGIRYDMPLEEDDVVFLKEIPNPEKCPVYIFKNKVYPVISYTNLIIGKKSNNKIEKDISKKIFEHSDMT